MSKISRYCKAYPVARFREYPKWPDAGVLVSEKPGSESNVGLVADGVQYLFVHDSYVVTGNVFPDEQIVFDAVTPEWKEFCRTNLGFVVPEDHGKGPAK